MARPTEQTTVQAAAALITATQIGDPAAPLPTKVVPRWILALSIGEAITHLAKKDGGGALLPVNSWVLTTSSWVPSKVKSDSGRTATPTNFTPGFDDLVAGSGDLALARDYKIKLTGTLKIWQVLEYKQGTDSDNSEIDAMNQRQEVIDSFTRSPRIGLDWPDFEHDELKFTSIGLLPFGTTLLHVSQGNLPFSFTYVVNAA